VNLSETLLSKYAETASAGFDTSSTLAASHMGHTEYEEPITSESGVRVIQANTTNAAAYAGVGRNDPCPCGSGKKYKQCHGK
jgi:preprotein translocase subunit SecA